ncbi:MAG: metal ABC transporter substrate-binding protein [Clostridiales Family XIII bacterium]|nr:metal ABC transporter substrate-binding protein [Clostridiales Family XIII bacterium]
MKKTRLIALLLAAILVLGAFAGCSSKKESDSSAKTSGKEASEEADSTTITGIVDLVPHNDLIEFVKDQVEEQGYTIDIVSTASDETTNEKIATGEITFSFNQHWPYLAEWNETNGFDLVNAGDIHIEPITAYSDKYTTVDEIPADAVVAIPNDGTNEYRALRILEQNGFIKLDPETATSLKASAADVVEYLKPIEIVELDSAQIIPTKDDYEFFITNTNKALEAKIESARLFSEGDDSPYANIITTTAENKDNPAIVALVEALRSDETKAFIEEKYNGAVIPAK